MIKPEAIQALIRDTRAALRSDNGKQASYLAGKREGFDMCLTSASSITAESAQQAIDYSTSNKYSMANADFRSGIADATIEVQRIIQRDDVIIERHRRMGDTEYAHIQYGG